jgi:hypothetical protein
LEMESTSKSPSGNESTGCDSASYAEPDLFGAWHHLASANLVFV